MSTSPSWFDQDKFSRLVKKVGPKPPAGGSPTPVSSRVAPLRPPEKETQRIQRSLLEVENAEKAEAPPEPPAAPPGTEPISGFEFPIRATPPDPSEKIPESTSNFPPPMPLPEIRSVSPLARRTSPLPNLKPIFEYEKSPAAPAEAAAAAPTETAPEVSTAPEAAPVELPKAGFPESDSDDMPPGWQAFRPTTGQPPSASESATAAELDQARKERDAAQAQVAVLQAQLRQADEIIQATAASTGGEELARVEEERDRSRRDYVDLREQYENLKKEQATRAGGGGFQVGQVAGTSQDTSAEVDALKKEIETLQGQIKQVKDDSSVAHRGLALSQKALQETRSALRETSEALSNSKLAVENLKKETASLTQQNLALQAELAKSRQS